MCVVWYGVVCVCVCEKDMKLRGGPVREENVLEKGLGELEKRNADR